MALRINSTDAVLNVQRRIAQSTDGLRSTFERLSSGLRINRASDDAAGLSIAAGLNVDSRVFNQGVRNINDGISLLNIADGAVEQLSGILIRMRELSTQSATEVYSDTQRLALHEEAQALANEYNRIVESTTFNGLNLIDGQFGGLTIQAGYGLLGQIRFDIGEELSRAVGDGSYATPTAIASGSRSADVTAGDFNGDGFMDVATADNLTDNTVSVHLGNGDGTFQARIILPGGTDVASITTADLNNDGRLDLITTEANTDNSVSVYLGNGDGSFQARSAYAAASVAIDATTADLNNDGFLDIIAAGAVADNVIAILQNNGDGTFTGPTPVASGTNTQNVDSADFDGDGNADIVTANTTANTVTVHFGNGDYSFQAPVALATGNQTVDVETGDFNNDGFADIAAANNVDNTISVIFGNGDGTFQPQITLASGNQTLGVISFDVNGDEILDLASISSTPDDTVTTFISNGDGTFQTGIASFAGVNSRAIAAGDFNEDDAADIVSANFVANTFSLATANTTGRLATLSLVDTSIDTVAHARNAMSVIDRALQRVSSERGAIGSMMSRMNTASSNLTVSSENFRAAESQIMDADVAVESAQLTKFNILQQAGASILAQANFDKRLALQLLQDI